MSWYQIYDRMGFNEYSHVYREFSLGIKSLSVYLCIALYEIIYIIKYYKNMETNVNKLALWRKLNIILLIRR